MPALANRPKAALEVHGDLAQLVCLDSHPPHDAMNVFAVHGHLAVENNLRTCTHANKVHNAIDVDFWNHVWFDQNRFSFGRLADGRDFLLGHDSLPSYARVGSAAGSRLPWELYSCPKRARQSEVVGWRRDISSSGISLHFLLVTTHRSKAVPATSPARLHLSARASGSTPPARSRLPRRSRSPRAASALSCPAASRAACNPRPRFQPPYVSAFRLSRCRQERRPETSKHPSHLFPPRAGAMPIAFYLRKSGTLASYAPRFPTQAVSS